MLPAISLGSLVIPTKPLTILLGIWLGLSAVEWTGKRLEQSGKMLYGMASGAVIAGIVGARIGFVATHWSAYRSDLLGIIWPLNSGYHLWIGVGCAITFLIYYGARKKMPAAETMDALIAGMLVGFAFFSLSDFLGGPGLGKITLLPWGIDIFGIRRHPAQLYEIGIAIIALTYWFVMSRQRQAPGALFLQSVFIYAIGRVFVDRFRDFPWTTASGYHVIQLVGLAIGLGCLTLLARQNLSAGIENQSENGELG